ncbi:MAG: hypothetical protein JNM93_14255 [Bacteriovoracaceae bacterium]|nr:hypothetical protein [Bacteriovoracaceae bacterium]
MLEWSFLVGIILLLIYTALIIAREKTTYLEEAKIMRFHDLEFPIPRWWTQTEQQNSFWKFERTDTRYDWYANFQKLESHKAAAEILIHYLQQKNIKMDPSPESMVEENTAHLFKDKMLVENFSDFIRMEGTATQDEEERIYLDVVILKKENANTYYLLESRSSVLNGGVEGPYFEEALSRALYKTN